MKEKRTELVSQEVSLSLPNKESPATSLEVSQQLASSKPSNRMNVDEDANLSSSLPLSSLLVTRNCSPAVVCMFLL